MPLGRTLQTLAGFAVLLALAAASPGEPAAARPLRVLTSFYPMLIAALNVAKDVPGVEVSSMTKAVTGCLHDYQMTPGDMKKMGRADVFVVNGAGMERFLDTVRRESPGVKVVDASEGIELLAAGPRQEGNPHVWCSISLHVRQVRNMAAGLAAADPAHAELYARNATNYIAKLDALRGRVREALAELRTRDIVTFHEAFPYFAREFGLNIVAVIDREPGSEPSARELAGIVDVVRKAGVKALFAEPQYSAKSAHVIARETGARVYTLDPAVTGPEEPDAYLRSMERNLAELVKALK
jgi:zinc transport system substrate-binding protein